ncbi:MAG: ligand-binding sensor domain-containing protein [Cognaticolwellia sp.]|jgi:ligand-binding sensor domain-containing protein
MKKYILIIGIMVLAGSELAFGQFAEWTNYASPEYLTDHVETSNEIWFSSKAGVFQLNKTSLQITEHNRSNSDISSNSVEAVAVDGNGFIWVGTYNQAIAKFDGSTWATIPYPDSLFSTPYGFTTHCIEVDNQNKVWIGTSEGLLSYDGTNWQVYNEENGILDMNNISGLTLDNQGNIYIASDFVFKYNGTAFQKISTQPYNNSFYDKSNFVEQSNGNIWFSNTSGKLGRYDGTNWTDFPTQNSILSLGESPNGEMFFTAENQGKYIYQNGAWVKGVDIVNSDIDINEITTYFYDNQGNEWIGSHDKILINDGQNVTVKSFRTHTINDNRIEDVTVDGNGNMYIVNHNEIALFDGTTWSNFPSPTGYKLRSILFTNNDNIWVHSLQGLHYWDGTNWTLYTTQTSALPTLSINKWYFEEGTQTLWLATTQGLVKFDGTNFTVYDPSNTPLTNDYIYSFDFDNNGLMYLFVGGSSDIFTFDGTIWQNISASLPIYSFISKTMHFDNNNTFWIGTSNDGLNKLENGNWVTFDITNSNLPSNNISQIISNENGKLFIATLNGLATLENGIIEGFTIENSGISDNLIFDLAFDNNDNLWLATVNGVSVFELNTTNTTTILVKNNSLNVFPNPISTTATVTFDLNQVTENIRVKIISLDGRTVQEQLIQGRANYGTQQLEINRNQIVNGLYYLTIQTDNEQLVKSILIQD